MESWDLGLLTPLDALLQEGSVTGAARRLGLSTPAMSHALARLRTHLGDPLLVRAGRGLSPTPRAQELAPLVHALVLRAHEVLTPPRTFSPTELDRTFVVHASDYVLEILGGALDARLAQAAPGLALRFVPNSPDDAAAVQGGGSDLAIGIYGELPQEMRTRRLLTDRFVCAVRHDHPVGTRLTLARYLALTHVQVAPRGLPGGYVDDVLRARGLARRVVRAVPYFHAGLRLVARTDHVLTVSERLARAHARELGLRVLPPPLPLRPYALSLVWHPRVDADPAHRWLREQLVACAAEVAAEVHDDARTRLDVSDPTSGRGRRRLRPLHGTKP